MGDDSAASTTLLTAPPHAACPVPRRSLVPDVRCVACVVFVGMKLVKKNLEKDGTGSIKLLPQEPEDMWHLYNLIAMGDRVTAVTFRKVVQLTSTGSTSSQKVRLVLEILVDKIEYDVLTCTMRISGPNRRENAHVKMGQHHTLELALHRDFTLDKDCWDAIYLQRVDMACDVSRRAEIAAVVLQQGLAHVCLITEHMTIVRAKIEVAVPRKRMGSSTRHEKGLGRFYDAVCEAIRRHIDFKVVKVCILASPGFIKDDLHRHLFAAAEKEGWKPLLEARPKFVLCHSSSGYKHALKEVLADPAVVARISATRAYDDVRALDAFFSMLNQDPSRAFYGFRHVRAANEQQAIQTLLVTDELFRAADLATRRAYVALTESAEANGAEVRILSALHATGEQLGKVSGVAALLRFPLPDLDELSMSDDDSDDSDGGGGGARAPAATPSRGGISRSVSSSSIAAGGRTPATPAADGKARAPTLQRRRSSPRLSSSEAPAPPTLAALDAHAAASAGAATGIGGDGDDDDDDDDGNDRHVDDPEDYADFL